MLFKTFVNASEHFLLVCQALVPGREHGGQLCARRGRSFDRRSENATRIFWCPHGQMVGEPAKGADFVHEGDVAAEVPTEELRGLSPNTGRSMSRQEHNDLDNAADIGDGRVPLASTRKTDVSPVWRNLGVTRLDAVQCLASIIFGLMMMMMDDDDDGS